MRTRIAQVVERRARNPEVRIPVLVQIFPLRSYKINAHFVRNINAKGNANDILSIMSILVCLHSESNKEDKDAF